MNTPICDFVRRYAESDPLRLHMPGHKGVSRLGFEAWDITEIHGADSLYEADGMIRESEKNAGTLFGAETFYSTEGSSLCIRAMLYLAVLYAQKQGRRPLVYAGRNAHKTFLSAAALLDLDVIWLFGKEEDSYLSCRPDAGDLERMLSETRDLPVAVYLTAPDYLGNLPDIRPIAEVCHRYGILLLVDNAHGAYLKFLPRSRHPIDLGADLCCDSAHKTLPVLTGGAYLHLAPRVARIFAPHAKRALALFGSTSPSYLILQSLDAVNPDLCEDYPKRLADYLSEVQGCKEALCAQGYVFIGDEPLKLTVNTKAYGYEGVVFAQLLRAQKIECEFADPDFVVLMLTPEIGSAGLHRMQNALCGIPKRPVMDARPPRFSHPERVLSVRQATLYHAETVPVAESLDRILAAATVGCPPAVPIVACGERINIDAIRCFAYYGITDCTVVVES